MAEKTTPRPATDRTEVRYDAHAIEEKWLQRWEENSKLYAAEPAGSPRPKYYVLEMLPYPSGALHMGHVRNYSIGDCLARYLWMRGYNVMHPMGWDAFGLPAENAALKHGVPPKQWTLENIARMKSQMKRMGFAYDWSTEVATCFPEFYRWNQWFFLKMYERGLAYRKKSKVNWCPKCATVLANEQVVNGFCWRHEDTLVEQRELEQWFLRITQYADALLRDIDKLEGWPQRVRSMQRNWIGRSEGAEVQFKLEGPAGPAGDSINVFTTRIDTIFGATSIQLAPEHPLVADLVAGNTELAQAVEQLRAEQNQARKDDAVAAIEKRGVFTGRYAINPFNDERLPIWVANYILMEYGTGAIMSVPAHDERDYEFAKKYDVEIRMVILPRRDEEPARDDDLEASVLPYTGTESLLVNSGPFSGMSCADAMREMAAYAQQRGFGHADVTFRLRDWGISRQRYWGTPIPILYCDQCGIVPVPEKDLPVVLPENVEITLQGTSPLARVSEWVNTNCPKCGGSARRETDTMDTFVDSSWYFYRYISPHQDDAPFDKHAIEYWFPVDQYIGGITHAILHLMYMRFWTKVMRDIGLVKLDEPVKRLYTQGMVTFQGSAMSKSRGNVVAPDEIVARYGADSARMYILFAAPPDRDVDWNDSGIEGIHRFLGRVYRFVTRNAQPDHPEWRGQVPPTLSSEARQLQRKLHQTIKRISDELSERWHFNTCVAGIMELMNELYGAEDKIGKTVPISLMGEAQRTLVLLLHPFAPYLAHELWSAMGETSNLLRASWPKYDPELAREEEIEIAVQVNGRIRTRLVIPADTPDARVRELALADPKVVASLDGRQVVRAIVVPGKLVNVVVK